jgi:hypothetical protein
MKTVVSRDVADAAQLGTSLPRVTLKGVPFLPKSGTRALRFLRGNDLSPFSFFSLLMVRFNDRTRQLPAQCRESLLSFFIEKRLRF